MKRFGYERDSIQIDAPYSVSSNDKNVRVNVTGNIGIDTSGRLYGDIMALGNYQKPLVVSFIGPNAEIGTAGFATLIRTIKDRKNENLLLTVDEENALRVRGARDIARLEGLIAIYQAPKIIKSESRVAA